MLNCCQEILNGFHNCAEFWLNQEAVKRTLMCALWYTLLNFFCFISSSIFIRVQIYVYTIKVATLNLIYFKFIVNTKMCSNFVLD